MFCLFTYIYHMNKLHMADKAGNALCENVATGKRFELVADRAQVSCKKCLKMLAWSGVNSMLPEAR
jgi:hypothetical protein